MENRDDVLWCDDCGGYMMVLKDGTCDNCGEMLQKEEPENDLQYHEYMMLLREQDIKRQQREEW